MKKKPTKINDLSKLGSVINFKTIDEKAYDGDHKNRFHIDEIGQWVQPSDYKDLLDGATGITVINIDYEPKKHWTK